MPTAGEGAVAPLPYGGVPGLVLPPNYSVYLTQTRRAVGIVGLVIALIGVALTVACFTALDWLSGDDGFGATTTVDFKDLHDLVGSDSPTLPRLYFSWLGWVLLAAVAGLGLLGNLPTRSHPLWRVLGGLIGLAGRDRHLLRHVQRRHDVARPDRACRRRVLAGDRRLPHRRARCGDRPAATADLIAAERPGTIRPWRNRPRRRGC